MLDERITPPSIGLSSGPDVGAMIRTLAAVGIVGAVGAGLGYGSGRLMGAKKPNHWAVGGAVLSVGVGVYGFFEALNGL